MALHVWDVRARINSLGWRWLPLHPSEACFVVLPVEDRCKSMRLQNVHLYATFHGGVYLGTSVLDIACERTSSHGTDSTVQDNSTPFASN